jgi:hypothetical protein
MGTTKTQAALAPAGTCRANRSRAPTLPGIHRRLGGGPRQRLGRCLGGCPVRRFSHDLPCQPAFSRYRVVPVTVVRSASSAQGTVRTAPTQREHTRERGRRAAPRLPRCTGVNGVPAARHRAGRLPAGLDRQAITRQGALCRGCGNGPMAGLSGPAPGLAVSQLRPASGSRSASVASSASVETVRERHFSSDSSWARYDCRP